MECRNCRNQVEDNTAVCPHCEAVLKDPWELKKKPEKRPTADVRYELVSTNYNGLFKIRKCSDGSYICDCPSFLTQNGTKNGDYPFVTCKHIRSYISEHPDEVNCSNPRLPSEWQRLL